MLSILAVVLGLVIIVSAIGADRSARARHTFRAIALNLCGIGCLALGLVSVYAWSHHGLDRSRQVAVAIPAGELAPAADRATMVQLVVGSDGRLEHLVATSDVGRAEAASAELVEAELAEAEQTAEVEATLEEIDLGGLEPLADEQVEAELDPELGSRVEIDFEARPEWVDQPDRDLGEVHLISIAAGPYRLQRDARKELSRQLKIATDEYLNEVVGHRHASRWIGYDKDEIRHRFVAPAHIYDEKVISPSFGVMHQSHALLEFGPAFHQEVEQDWHQVMARTQLAKVALTGGAVLGMLVLMFGYFNADSATRGFYSGRLKFVTVVAILAVVATGLLIARSIPWLWL